jgi:hypothetical protein
MRVLRSGLQWFEKSSNPGVRQAAELLHSALTWRTAARRTTFRAAALPPYGGPWAEGTQLPGTGTGRLGTLGAPCRPLLPNTLRRQHKIQHPPCTAAKFSDTIGSRSRFIRGNAVIWWLQVGYATSANLDRAEDLLHGTESERGPSNPLMSAENYTGQPVPIPDPLGRLIERFAPFLYRD